MKTLQPAESGSLHPICSAWWMYDNHTFQPVDVTSPNWRGYVMTCYAIDGFGSFFVRAAPNGETIFHLHGRGEEGREAFAAALAAWTPPNAELCRPREAKTHNE
jgi:hypothetical protein